MENQNIFILAIVTLVVDLLGAYIARNPNCKANSILGLAKETFQNIKKNLVSK